MLRTDLFKILLVKVGEVLTLGEILTCKRFSQTLWKDAIKAQKTKYAYLKQRKTPGVDTLQVYESLINSYFHTAK